MPITIRPATVQDAPSITEIIKLAFEEDASQDQIQTCIQHPNFHTFLAISEEKVTGFIFGFITTSHDGKKRWELDLQAVHPDYQGQGIGTKLIQHFTSHVTTTDCIRALIAVSNIRMEKALTRLGYEPEDEIVGLYVTSQSLAETPLTTPDDSHPIPVITMTYNGIWLEGKISENTINAALSSKNHENDVVGAVVPISDQSVIEALKSANFNFIKQYRRWHKPIF